MTGAPVDTPEAPPSDGVIDRAGREPERQQLGASDEPALRRGDVSDLTVRPPRAPANIPLGSIAAWSGTFAARRDANVPRLRVGIPSGAFASLGDGNVHPADGLPHVFAINTLSVYILTALIDRPKRLVYLSSGMHHHADANLDDILWQDRSWNGSQAYAESKLHDAMLAFGVARRWPDVLSNSLEPGWVPTKMGGPGAPDDMNQAHLTQAWLAASDEPKAQVTGKYFYHLKRTAPNPQADDPALQDQLIAICAKISGNPLPA